MIGCNYMPNFTLEFLPDEPILLFTATADYSPARDLPISNPQVFAMMESVTAPIFYIVDARQISVSIMDIVQVVAAAVRGKMATFSHPNVRTVVMITSNRTIKMAASGVGAKDHQKEAHIHIVSTMEEALDYCRTQIKADQSTPEAPRAPD